MVRKNRSQVTRALLLSLLFSMLSSAAWAVPSVPGEVFDDFEDGDTSDWGFFGGNNAGGGGGAAVTARRKGRSTSAPAGAARVQPVASTVAPSRTCLTARR